MIAVLNTVEKTVFDEDFEVYLYEIKHDFFMLLRLYIKEYIIKIVVAY